MQLHAMKQIDIIANVTLEERLAAIAGQHNASGYTVLEARGAGSAGLQTGVLEGESNILFILVVPEVSLDAVLHDIEKLTKRGHRLAVFISDTQVMRQEKYI
jgi:nitrogen regulatory protein PII